MEGLDTFQEEGTDRTWLFRETSIPRGGLAYHIIALVQSSPSLSLGITAASTFKQRSDFTPAPVLVRHQREAEKMQNIRAKIKRKLSLHDKNPNLDDNYDPDDIDEETTGHLHREIEKAEAEGHTHGKPGSFLNKLIMHGNSKTEKELAGEGSHLAKENAKP